MPVLQADADEYLLRIMIRHSAWSQLFLLPSDAKCRAGHACHLDLVPRSQVGVFISVNLDHFAVGLQPFGQNLHFINQTLLYQYLTITQRFKALLESKPFAEQQALTQAIQRLSDPKTSDNAGWMPAFSYAQLHLIVLHAPFDQQQHFIRHLLAQAIDTSRHDCVS